MMMCVHIIWLKTFYDRCPSGLSGALEDLGIAFSGRQHCGELPQAVWWMDGWMDVYFVIQDWMMLETQPSSATGW